MPSRSALPPLILAGALLAAPFAEAQPPFRSVPALLDSLEAASALADASARDAALDAIWSNLRVADRIPFTAGDSALFLWRGSASGVSVAGDHTGWSPSATPLRRLGLGDVWARADRFPEAARLDYKLVVGGSWILDPNNPHQQWSGFGPNSELRMPTWVFPEETVRGDGVPAGTMGPQVTLTSTHYGTPVLYRVYTPAAYDGETPLPVVYVTDGHEYADARLGALPIVLDNLIASGDVEPALIVFVDPRYGGTNRRQEQYVQNDGFARLIAEDLVPAIDAAYATRTDAASRVILGTSLGGLFSVYLGLNHPDVFGKLAVQSPAFWVSESPDWWSGASIYDQVEAASDTWQIHMTTGTINDTEDGARRMRDVMTARGLDLTYAEVPEGHSWGNWRALLDDALRTLLPAGIILPTEPPPAGGLRLRAFPNPARAFVTFEVDGSAHPVRVACADSLGREVLAVTTNAHRTTHAVRVPLAAFAPGVYACTARSGDARTVRTVTIAR